MLHRMGNNGPNGQHRPMRTIRSVNPFPVQHSASPPGTEYSMQYSFSFPNLKVATYLHVYRAKPKEPTQFGSVSGSEIHNLPFSYSGIVSLYRSEPKEPT